ncbi:contractile injection system tape measure protein [Bradyrhizobium prioriisuperbiae]|uniref:contractile injection system tape measure protein n=1 Tax=Bradyrhizobium prioriisuperbiae TaxID=2854389 RepID=UPI0028EED858|nr:contractile injection system tape measure protein [Bradyrhizobium prioritasuperba]
MIRQQILDFDVDSEALALALQPGIADINRRRILPLIERVLDELAPFGQRIKIARLDIDLGDLPIENLEQAIEDALYPALRDAVEQALRSASNDASADVRVQPETMSQLDLLEHYLLGGTLQFLASGQTFSAEELVLELSSRDPANLVAMMRRHAHDQRFLERIVLQLDGTSIGRLLHLLAPEHAALILAYMLDLRHIHRIEPLLGLHDDELKRLLWVLVLSYVLRDPGSHFNRKSFLRWLLEGVAQSATLDYGDLVKTLQRGLDETERHQSLTSSLPAVLNELLQELSAEDTESSRDEATAEAWDKRAREFAPPLGHGGATSRLASLTQFLLHGTWPSSGPARSTEQRVLELLQAEPDGLRDLIRRHGARSGLIQRLVGALSEATLQRMLNLLDHEHAALILTYLADIRRAHRAAPLMPLTDDRFAQLLWILSLTYVVRDPGTQFNRKSFVHSLLKDIAQREGLDLADLSRTLQLGLQAVEAHPAPASSLLGIIRELADDRVLWPLDPSRSDAEVEADHESDLDNYLSHRRMLAGWEAADAGARLRDLLVEAATTGVTSVADLLRRLARRAGLPLSALINRLLLDMEPAELLALMAPAHQAAITDLIGRISQDQQPAGSAAATQDALWVAALDHLLGHATGSLNLAAMHRHIVAAVRPDVEAVLPDESSSSVPARDDRAHALISAPIRAFAAYDQAETLRYVLRYGLLPWAALLRDTHITVERSFADLLRLSPAALQSIVAGVPVGEQAIMATRLAHALPEDTLLALLLRLLPPPGETDSPFRSSLMTFADQANDRRVFYASVIAAMLDGRVVDLDELTSRSAPGAAVGPILADDLSNAAPHAIKSVLTGRLRAGADVLPAEPTTATLLKALMTRDPDDARDFLQAAGEQRDLRAALARQDSANVLQAVIDALYPAEAAVLHAIVRSLAAPSPGRRFDADPIHGELLLEGVLSLATGRRLTADFLRRLLNVLFGEPLPDQARAALARALPLWRQSSPLLATQADSFAAIIANDQWNFGAPAQTQSPSRTDATPRLEDAVLAFLRDDSPDLSGAADAAGSDRFSADMLTYALGRMLDSNMNEVADVVRQAVADRRQRERWIQVLPGSALARLAYLIEPKQHHALLTAAEILVAAWRQSAPHGSASPHAQLWGALLDFLAEHQSADRSVEQLVTDFLARSAAVAEDFAARWFVQAGRLAQAAGHTQLVAALGRTHPSISKATTAFDPSAAEAPANDTGKPPNAPHLRPATPKGNRLNTKTAFSLLAEDARAGGEPIYIGNAGLVLTSPFLPHLFQKLDLLGQNDKGRPRLRDRQAISRAVHLLQYLVDGRTAAPEPLLVLNKVLCGVPISTPVAREITPTDDETRLCESLLKSMIASWPIIASTSVTGLRETFLQREGKLQRLDDGWKLRVQRKTVDVLVDQVPWSISILFHAWMPEPLHVNW